MGVSERLVRPHPLVASWLTDHEQRLKEARTERDPWMRRLKSVPDFTDADRRRHRILDSLFKFWNVKGRRCDRTSAANSWLRWTARRWRFNCGRSLSRLEGP